VLNGCPCSKQRAEGGDSSELRVRSSEERRSKLKAQGSEGIVKEKAFVVQSSELEEKIKASREFQRKDEG
jgi:hypothetical protein